MGFYREKIQDYFLLDTAVAADGESGLCILEANYRTPCLEGCGKAYISGRRWLLYQAVAGYGIFTGETPDADAMFRIFC